MGWARQAVALARCATQLGREGEKGAGPGGLQGTKEMWDPAGPARLGLALRPRLRPPPDSGRHGLQMCQPGGRAGKKGAVTTLRLPLRGPGPEQSPPRPPPPQGGTQPCAHSRCLMNMSGRRQEGPWRPLEDSGAPLPLAGSLLSAQSLGTVTWAVALNLWLLVPSGPCPPWPGEG